MFTGYEISDGSRDILLQVFPPKYERIICHHITEQYGVPKSASPPEAPEKVQVIGYVDSGDGVEGLLVAINGNTKRPDGETYHITLSINHNRKPADTNKYIGQAKTVPAIDLRVTPRNFW